MKKLSLFMLTAVLALTAGVARAQDSALLDLLVKKKVITDQEAEETRAALSQEYSATSAGKFNISSSVSSINIYGDARMRNDYRSAQQVGTADNSTRERIRTRLRIGADIKVMDDWMLGVRLETGNSARSTNVTFSDNPQAPFGKAGTSTATVVNGVTTTTTKTGTTVNSVTTKTTTTSAVNKVNNGYSLFIGQLYLKYSPYSWLTLQGGKMPNPLVTTDMVWDKDISPEGFSEQFKYTIGPFGGAGDVTTTDGKTGKPVITSGEPGNVTVDLFANFGQFVYNTADPQSSFGSTADKQTAWLLAYQVGAKVNFSKTTYFQIAPTFYEYIDGKNNDFTTTYSGDPGKNQTGVNDLAIFDCPWLFGWTAFDLPMSIFGDFAYDINADQRASKAGHPGQTQGLAYQVGLNVGDLKKKGHWQMQGYWQRSEAYALDPNLIDDDTNDARLNMQGVVFKAGYALTENFSLSLQYNYGKIINKSLGTGGSGGAFGTTQLDNTQLLFLNANLTF